jgi:hypothetical protein
MGIKFIGQPFGGGGQIGSVLADGMRDATMSRLWIATAWGKRSGIGRIQRAAADFRAGGGTSEVIVGIDEGGATREGLTACLDAFDDVFIYHDPGPRTFHPKIYAVEGQQKAMLVVGSGNLTRGGLFTNYEAAFVVDAVLGESEWHIRDDVRGYFDALLGVGEAVRPLDAELIELLGEEGWVTSEATQNRRRSAESRERRERPQLFGGSVSGLAGAPPSEAGALPAEEQDEDSVMSAPDNDEVEPADDKVAALGVGEAQATSEDSDRFDGILGFWKQLSNSDASLGSSPGQIIVPIRYADFFPTLVDESDLTEGTGSGQSAAYFALDFKDGTFTKHVPEARVILYEPAPHHPRPNRELRFTFHDREILLRLAPGDVLVFTTEASGYRVERRPPGSMGPGRFGSLS